MVGLLLSYRKRHHRQHRQLPKFWKQDQPIKSSPQVTYHFFPITHRRSSSFLLLFLYKNKSQNTTEFRVLPFLLTISITMYGNHSISLHPFSRFPFYPGTVQLFIYPCHRHLWGGEIPTFHFIATTGSFSKVNFPSKLSFTHVNSETNLTIISVLPSAPNSAPQSHLHI